MKKISLSLFCGLLACSVCMLSCIGSFGLFKGLLTWNKKVSNKFVNEILFILLSPAYAVCGVVDLFVLNTVEFWSGKNPIRTADIGKTRQVWGQDGKLYAVKTLRDGYDIAAPDGTRIRFTYNEADRSWSMDKDGQAREMFRFNGDGTIRAILPDGTATDVALNAEGAAQLRQAVDGDLWMAWR